MLPAADEILSNFELLEDPHEQFEYLMELGRLLPPLPPGAHTEDRLVPGCQSRVWLCLEVAGSGPAATLRIAADSDAHITKGLVAFLVALYGDQPVRRVLDTDAVQILRDLGLGQHVTSKRSNGLRSMVERIKAEAGRAIAPAA
ncbi:SufE family protein [Enterovirga sp.]|jgi:cysteine desulfuration protein SufE|uniref:SufE family protein n=1 Tax=Enterovirga sp. TaxID=2026350 RepID=UPI0026255C04|nr:SufE family protein [Enterovirga sp.]MDB5590698.1 cysteine desufuration protein SufE [Enterovirga sp.]